MADAERTHAVLIGGDLRQVAEGESNSHSGQQYVLFIVVDVYDV